MGRAAAGPVGEAYNSLYIAYGRVYSRWAGRAAGGAAAEAATPTVDAPVPTGPVGAGTGATVGTWRGRDHARPGGLGVAVVAHGSLTVAVVVAVNAAGDIGDPATSTAVADGVFRGWPESGDLFTAPPVAGAHARSRGNTTIGAVVTDAGLHFVLPAPGLIYQPVTNTSKLYKNLKRGD